MHIITGGFGQVGLYLLKKLLADREEVLLFDVQPNLPDLELICGKDATGRVQIEIGDLSTPTRFVSTVAAYRPDTIIHLGSVILPASETDAHFAMQQNIGGMINVLEAARIFGTRRVLYASAPSVFGSPRHHGAGDVVLGDDAPQYPATLYGISKSANERIAGFYRRTHGVDSIGFRLCQGYGPGKRRGRAFGYQMFENAIRGLPVTLSYGDDVINWQYIEDIAEIFYRAISMRHASIDVYNTTGDVVSVTETAAIFKRLAPDIDVTVEPGIADIVWRYDVSRLADDVGFTSPTPVSEGFAKTLETLRKWARHEG